MRTNQVQVSRKFKSILRSFLHIISGTVMLPRELRWLISILSALGYGAVFLYLIRTPYFYAAYAFALIPLFVISQMLGIIGGIIAGIFILPADLVMLYLVGGSPNMGLAIFITIHAFFFILGVLFGSMQELQRRLQLELTQHKHAQEKLLHLASHDPLTGIANRVMFFECSNAAISRSRRLDAGVAVLFMDLDDFKDINDKYGHALGDRVLVEAAKRITTVLRDSDCIARIGGDEFAITLEFIDKPEPVRHICDRILASLHRPIEIDHFTIQLSASIGIALYPSDSEDLDTLLQYADSAMYAAKKQEQKYVFYSELLPND